MTERRQSTPDVVEAAHELIVRDGRVAVATIISTWGSAPVPVGGQMAISEAGDFQGSVSGGCVEGEVIAEASELLVEGGRPRILSYGVEDETAWRVGLPCGGKIQILVERLEGAADRVHLKRLTEARTSRQALVVRTSVADGARQVFARSDVGVADDIVQRFFSGKSTVEPSAAGDVFVHALLPPPRVVIVGATHIGQVLADLVAITGFQAVVVDPRTAFAAEARFSSATLVTEWPQDALPQLGLDAYTAVAALAHVGHIDDEALKLAVASECFYVGALGSKRNHAKRVERLAAGGVTAEQIARIRSPIGLDLGASTPPEIALSVMAEILRHLRGIKGKGAA
ncbi:MAG: XdhC family protein [Hyphomicrobiaceae bacterium]|nr:XdhC family protein [Hyphomicrobiaceae bacterium]